MTVLPGSGYDVFGLSRYMYVEGNPISRTDPSGNALCKAASSFACGGAAGPSSTPARIPPGLREDPRRPGTKVVDPCAYGMEDPGCDAEMGTRMGYYSGDLFFAEHQRCYADPSCRQGTSDVAGYGLLFVPGPDFIEALGIGTKLASFSDRVGGVVGKLFGKLFERGGAEASTDLSGLERVGSALKSDASHRAAAWMADAPGKQAFTIVGNDGVTRTLYQLERNDGVYEWIVEWSDGRQVITHERYIVGGKVTGVPNQ